MAGVMGPGSNPPPKGSGRTHAFVYNMDAQMNRASSNPQVSNLLQNYDYSTWLDSDISPSIDYARFNKDAGLASSSAMAYMDPYRAYNQKNTGIIRPSDNKDPNVVGSLSDEDMLAWTREGTYDDSDLGPAQGNWDIPTSTSNFKRPRTVAAGYDKVQKLLTVVFRDGTFWNYYDVSNDEWIKFHNAYSKGELLNKGGSIYENHRGDAANMSSMSPDAQRFFVAVSRAAQITFRDGAVKRGSKTGSQPLRSKNKRLKSEYDRQRRASIKATQSSSASASAGRNNSRGGKNRPTANKPN